MLLVAACVPKDDDTDLTGDYVVHGELVASGATTPITDETVIVKRTMRHYDGASYAVTARGCTLTGDGTLTTAGIGAQCAFEGFGQVNALGHIIAENNGELEVLVTGSSLDGGAPLLFEYRAHATRKR